MEYAGKEIRKWYYDTLTGIKVDGVTIPIRNYPNINEAPPFIALVNQTQGDYATKGKEEFAVSILVQVYTSNVAGFNGDFQADAIADEVMKKIKGNYGKTTNFEIVTTNINANESFHKIDATRGLIIRQIEFTHFVSKNLNLS